LTSHSPFHRLRRGGAAATAFVVLAVAAPTAGAQQSRVVPGYFANNEGNTSGLRPFASDAFRFQMIVAGGELASNVAILNEFAFRRDNTNQSMTYNGFTWSNLTVAIGYAARPPASMSTSFASNRLGTQMKVFSGNYHLPNQPPASKAPFNIAFKLGTPWVYARSSGDVLIEMTIPGTNTTKNQYPVDAIGAGPGTMIVRDFGTKGGFASKDAYSVTNTAPTHLLPGGSVDLGASGLKSAYPAIVVYGFSNKAFGPIPLPFDLTGLGMAGNHLYVSLDLVLPLPVAKDATGLFGGSTRVPVPPAPWAAGATIYAQAAFFDQPSNAAGLVWSNGVESRTSQTPISPLQSLYADDSTAASGFFPITGFGGMGGLVTQFKGPVFN